MLFCIDATCIDIQDLSSEESDVATEAKAKQAQSAISTLLENNHHVAILSTNQDTSSDKNEMVKLLQGLGLWAEEITKIMLISLHPNEKNHIEKAMKKAGITDANQVHFTGSREVDIAAAKQAGYQTLFSVDWIENPVGTNAWHAFDDTHPQLIKLEYFDVLKDLARKNSQRQQQPQQKFWHPSATEAASTPPAPRPGRIALG